MLYLPFRAFNAYNEDLANNRVDHDIYTTEVPSPFFFFMEVLSNFLTISWCYRWMFPNPLVQNPSSPTFSSSSNNWVEKKKKSWNGLDWLDGHILHPMPTLFKATKHMIAYISSYFVGKQLGSKVFNFTKGFRKFEDLFGCVVQIHIFTF